MKLFWTLLIPIPSEKIESLCCTCGRLLIFTWSAKEQHEIISDSTIVTLSFSFLTLKNICISPVIRYSAHFVQHDQHWILKKPQQVLFWSDDFFIVIVGILNRLKLPDFIDSLVTSTIESDLRCMTPRLLISLHLWFICRTRLFVQGSIQYNNYVDQEGIKRYNTSIVPSMLSTECLEFFARDHKTSNNNNNV